MAATRKLFLGVIPARSGSKTIKNKNIKLLNGIPLIAHSIRAAQKSKYLSDCIVSTNSKAFAEVARRFGGKVPFLRPAHLAQDKTPTMPVVKHALLEYEKMTGRHYDYVVLLQPTTPLRLAKDIDRAIELMSQNPQTDNIVSCYKSENVHPKKMYVVKNGRAHHYIKGNDGMFRRQDVEKMYIRNGSVYVLRRDLVLKEKMFGERPMLMEMPRLRSIDIDMMDDWILTELIMQKKLRGHA